MQIFNDQKSIKNNGIKGKKHFIRNHHLSKILWIHLNNLM